MTLKVAKHHWKKTASSLLSNNKHQDKRNHLVSGHSQPKIKGHGE